MNRKKTGLLIIFLIIASAVVGCTVKISRLPVLPTQTPLPPTKTVPPSPTAFPSVPPTSTAAPAETVTGTPTNSPVPPTSSTPTVTPAPSPTATIYVVQSGDSLNRIAHRYGTTAEAIALANGIAVTRTLHIGQTLIIPANGAIISAQSSAVQQPSPIPPSPSSGHTSTPTATAAPTQVPTQTSAPVPLPTATTAPLPTATTAPVGTVSARNIEITIPAYAYETAFMPSEAADPIYPYPRMDFDHVGPPSPRTFQAILLENAYTAITIVPALGGRIYRWVDKTTGRDLLYRNPVLKPTHWGYRGWWLAAGGIEWAFPVDEHGLNEYRPWQVQAASTGDQVTFLVSDTEDHTGMTVSVAISLDSTHSYFTIRPRIYNPTGSAQPFQFWANAMIALANNRNTPSLRFVLPTDRVAVHSTSDPNLPVPKTPISWPVYNGRDLSLYGTWQGYLGFFASPRATQAFMGAYDTSVDEGIVRIFPPEIAQGAKVFGPGTLDPSLWTDDDSNYVELWGGVTPTFWDYGTLNAGETLTWEEHWYPVSGLGGYRFANELVAVNATVQGDEVRAALETSSPFAGQLLLRQGSTVIAQWPVTLTPGHPYRVFRQIPAGGVGSLSLQIQDLAGHPVASIPL